MTRETSPVQDTSAQSPDSTVSLDDIVEARATIRGTLAQTPAPSSSQLGAELDITLRLKAELLQKTGSFKPRGAVNRLRNTPREDLQRGLITVSAGNHAQGLAWAARAVGVSCTVVMPENASPSKVAAARGYGAEVVLHGTVTDAYERMEELRTARGLVLVHPFDDPLIVAGQGTVGLEIIEQVPDVDTIVCPVGGGGLLSGIAIAVKCQRPEVRVIGVEPEGAAAMRASLDRGEPVRLDAVDTVADGLAAPLAGQITYPLVRRYVDDIVTVTDEEILTALRSTLTYVKLLTEPGGSAAVAALLARKIPLRRAESCVAVLSGGNVDLDKLKRFL